MGGDVTARVTTVVSDETDLWGRVVNLGFSTESCSEEGKRAEVSWGGGAGGKGTLERQRVSERNRHREGGHISPGQCRTLHRTCLPLPPCAPTQEAD